MMCRLIAFLLTCSSAFAAVNAPPDASWTYEITLWDGSAVLTGKTVTLSVQRDSDSNYWTGAAWQASYTTVSGNMTERSGNISLEGKYYYTLSRTAVGTSPNTFRFSSKYTNGSDNIYNRETLQTMLPTVETNGAVSYVANVTGDVIGDLLGDIPNLSTGGLSTDEHSWLQYTYGRLGSTSITVTQFATTDGTINVTQGSDYPSGLIALSRTWPGEDLTGATCTVSVISKSGYDSGTGTVAINASSCTFTGGTTGSTLTVNVPLTHTQTAALSVSRYQYEVKITTGGGNVYRPFSGTMNVLRKVN